MVKDQEHPRKKTNTYSSLKISGLQLPVVGKTIDSFGKRAFLCFGSSHIHNALHRRGAAVAAVKQHADQRETSGDDEEGEAQVKVVAVGVLRSLTKYVRAELHLIQIGDNGKRDDETGRGDHADYGANGARCPHTNTNAGDDHDGNAEHGADKREGKGGGEAVINAAITGITGRFVVGVTFVCFGVA